jgi:alkanesulfonate monooxygenase SsuD/methylene tetrahydromethanopterin reductase-like flavin-dependent oxidoreductase (luciferase family)
MGLTFGVVVVQDVPWPSWSRRVLDVEALGYDTVWVWDHLVHRTLTPSDPLLDSFGLLSAVAPLTSRLRLGTLVASPTLRHPYLLVKQAMTLDHVSGGRLSLGIGAAGVLRDYVALGIPPWPKAEQVDRFRETVELVVAVAGGADSYAGHYYSGDELSIAPGFTRRPLPLTLAAHGPRTLRIAARYATTWNTIAPRDLPAAEAVAVAADLSAQLSRYAEDAGRDPSAIRRSVLLGSEQWPVRSSAAAFADAVRRFRDVGFTDFVLMHPEHPAEAAIGHGTAAPDIVERVAEMLPALRAG